MSFCVRYHFFIDFFTSIPVDFIVLQTKGQSSQWTQSLTSLRAFRFFKLFRVWRVGQFLGKIFRRFDINPAVILGMKLFAGFFVVTHGLSCFLFYIGTLTELFKSCDPDHECSGSAESASCNMLRWNQPICPCRAGNATASWCNSRTWLTETYFMMPGNRSVRAMDADVTNQYWITLYWVITTMATIGFGDIKPQTQYEIWTCILCQIIGAAAFGFIVGNMTNIAQLLNGRKEKLTGEIDELTVLLRHFKVPRDLQRHATKLVRHQFHKPVKLIKRDIIDKVPTWIAVDIAKEAFRNILHRSCLFAHAPTHIVDFLYLHLEPLTLVPGEYLFRTGDRSSAIIFILNGTVHLIDDLHSENKKQSALLYPRRQSSRNELDHSRTVMSSILAGGFVGENSIARELDFFNCSARASNTCDLLYLRANAVSRAFASNAIDMAKLRFKCNLRYKRFMCLMALTRKVREMKATMAADRNEKNAALPLRRRSLRSDDTSAANPSMRGSPVQKTPVWGEEGFAALVSLGMRGSPVQKRVATGLQLIEAQGRVMEAQGRESPSQEQERRDAPHRDSAEIDKPGKRVAAREAGPSAIQLSDLDGATTLLTSLSSLDDAVHMLRPPLADATEARDRGTEASGLPSSDGGAEGAEGRPERAESHGYHTWTDVDPSLSMSPESNVAWMRSDGDVEPASRGPKAGEAAFAVVSGLRIPIDGLDLDTRECVMEYSALRQGILDVDIKSFLGNATISADAEVLFAKYSVVNLEASTGTEDETINILLDNLYSASGGGHHVSLIEHKLKAILKRIKQIERVPGFQTQDAP